MPRKRMLEKDDPLKVKRTKGAFKRCVDCGGKIPASDRHTRCLFCLGEAHQVQTCSHCKNFTRVAMKNRQARLRLYLWDKSLAAPSKMDALTPEPQQSCVSEELELQTLASTASSYSSSKETPMELRKHKHKVPAAPGTSKKAKKAPEQQEGDPKPCQDPRTSRSSSLSLVSLSPEEEEVLSLDSSPYHHVSAWRDSLVQPHSPERPQCSQQSPTPLVPSQQGRSRSSSPPPRHPEAKLNSPQSQKSLENMKHHQPEPRRDHSLFPSPYLGMFPPYNWQSFLEEQQAQAFRSLPFLSHVPYWYPPSASLFRARGDSPTEWQNAGTQKEPAIPGTHLRHARGENGTVTTSHPSASTAARCQEPEPAQAEHAGKLRFKGKEHHHQVKRTKQSRPPSSSSDSSSYHKAAMKTKKTSVPSEAAELLSFYSEGELDSTPSAVESPSSPNDDQDSVIISTPESSVGEPWAPSPTEDHHTFSGLISRLAQTLDIELQQPPVTPQLDHVLDCLNKEADRPVYIGMLPSLLELAKESWQRPSSQVTSGRVENLYRVFDKEAAFLLKHPAPSSTIVKAAQTRARSRDLATPSSKEGRKLDQIGRRFYTTASLAMRVANYEAAMGAYQSHLWEKVQSILESAPDEVRSQLAPLCLEGTQLANQQMRSARHVLSTSAKGLSSAVVLRRYAWLRSVSLSEDARRRIEDLPFNGQDLFNSKTDDILNNLQKKSTMSKCMGVHSAGRLGNFCRGQVDPNGSSAPMHKAE